MWRMPLFLPLFLLVFWNHQRHSAFCLDFLRASQILRSSAGASPRNKLSEQGSRLRRLVVPYYAAPLAGPPGGDGLAATRRTRAGRGGWAGRARHAGRQVLGAMRRARLVPSILRPARAVVWLVLRAQGVGVRPAGRMRQPRVHRFRLLRAGLRRGPNPNPNPNQAAAQA